MQVDVAWFKPFTQKQQCSWQSGLYVYCGEPRHVQTRKYIKFET
jgi:hypothetical protein